MRIMLVQPGEGEGPGFRQMSLVEPLGLEAVAGNLAGHDILLLDLRVEGGLEDAVLRFRPDVCGINCSFTLDLYRALETAARVKGAGGTSPFVVVGGHYASLNPGDFYHPAVDAIVLGEGEQTMAELVECLGRGGDLSLVQGLALNSAERQTRTATRPLVKELDELPMPARELTRRHRRRYYLFGERPAAVVETARGCTYHCNFCSVWHFYRGHYRAKSPDRVAEEVATIQEPFILFNDDNFLADPERAREIAASLLSRGLRHRYAFQARSDSIVAYPEVLELWRRAGLTGVFVGIEKIDDSGLAGVGKQNSAANNEQAIEVLQRLGVGMTASFIVDPGWQLSDFERLRRYVASHHIDNPSFSVLTPLPGTVLYRQLRAQIQSWNYELYDLLHAVLPTRLPLPEFYAQFAALYRSGYSRKRLVEEAFRTVWKGVRMGSVSHLLGLARSAKRMGEVESYLAGHKRAVPAVGDGWTAVAQQGQH